MQLQIKTITADGQGDSHVEAFMSVAHLMRESITKDGAKCGTKKLENEILHLDFIGGKSEKAKFQCQCECYLTYYPDKREDLLLAVVESEEINQLREMFIHNNSANLSALAIHNCKGHPLVLYLDYKARVMLGDGRHIDGKFEIVDRSSSNGWILDVNTYGK